MEKEITNRPTGPLSFQEIMQILPHRYPFLFVDGLLDRDGTESASGYKNVSHNEPFLLRRPNRPPCLPESVVIECMSQVGAAAILSCPEYRGKIMLFAGLENLRIYRPVFAGERLVTHVQKVYLRTSGIGKMKAVARVDDARVADGALTFAVVDRVPMPEGTRT